MIALVLLSLTVAAAVSVAAWRVLERERRRSDARVAALARDIHGADFVHYEAPIDVPSEPPVTDTASPQLAAAGIGAMVVILLVVAAVMLGRSSGSSAAAATQTPAAAGSGTRAVAPGADPLELLSLDQERDGDQLVVRGVVRNPVTGATLDPLAAVVLLFNRDGSFLTSGRAAVEPPIVARGAEARFVITVPGATGVGRYRVSFRTDQALVPHVDRRSDMPVAARR